MSIFGKASTQGPLSIIWILHFSHSGSIRYCRCEVFRCQYFIVTVHRVKALRRKQVLLCTVRVWWNAELANYCVCHCAYSISSPWRIGLLRSAEPKSVHKVSNIPFKTRKSLSSKHIHDLCHSAATIHGRHTGDSLRDVANPLNKAHTPYCQGQMQTLGWEKFKLIFHCRSARLCHQSDFNISGHYRHSSCVQMIWTVVHGC